VLGRVQRNQGFWFAIALGLVVAAAAFWVISETGLPEGKWRSRGRVTSIVLAGVGAVLAFAFAVGTANDAERPALTVRLAEKTLALTGEATAGNLSSSDRLVVFVDGLIARTGEYAVADRLYQSYSGPDTDGNARNRVDVQLPPGRFDAVQVKAFTGAEASVCDRRAPQPLGTPSATLITEKSDTNPDPGCVILKLPRRARRPQVTALWEGPGSSADSLKVKVEASDIGVGEPKDRLVAVQAVGLRRGEDQRKRRLTLYRAFVEPPEEGAITRQFRVPIERGVRIVCAEARYVAPGRRMPSASCPLGKSEPPAVAAAQLRVPRQAAAPGQDP